MTTTVFLGYPPLPIIEWIKYKSVKFALNADGSATACTFLKPSIDGTLAFKGDVNSDGTLTVQAQQSMF